MKKAYEYSKICAADVCLGIRIRDSSLSSPFRPTLQDSGLV